MSTYDYSKLTRQHLPKSKPLKPSKTNEVIVGFLMAILTHLEEA